jgi:hypothetical protein
MARTKATLGSGARLADYLSAGLLARVFPAERVNAALDAHGRNTQRLRSFPAVVGVYYTVALSLYPEASYEEVFAAIGVIVFLLQIDTLTQKNSNSDKHLQKRLWRTACAFGAD